MNKKIISIFEKIKSSKKVQYLIIFIVFGIIFLSIIYSTFFSNKSSDEIVSSSEYVKELEDRLKTTLSSVKGAGKVSVVITVESGMETVIAMKTTTTETVNGKEIVETPILVNGKTVVLKENYPKIIGVLIVAEGAKNIAVLSKIQQATQSLLNINVNQIEILTMK